MELPSPHGTREGSFKVEWRGADIARTFGVGGRGGVGDREKGGGRIDRGGVTGLDELEFGECVEYGSILVQIGRRREGADVVEMGEMVFGATCRRGVGGWLMSRKREYGGEARGENDERDCGTHDV